MFLAWFTDSGMENDEAGRMFKNPHILHHFDNPKKATEYLLDYAAEYGVCDYAKK